MVIFNESSLFSYLKLLDSNLKAVPMQLGEKQKRSRYVGL